jgi:hypothetical protein
MTFLKKSENKSNDSSQYTGGTPGTPLKIKKKMYIGFGRKIKKLQNEETTAPPYISQAAKDTTQTIPSSTPKDIQKPFEKTDIFFDELTDNNVKIDNLLEDETAVEQNSLTLKRKTFAQKDIKGKQVYLEDTGEILGIVFDVVYDANKTLIGYKIKDSKSETILNFPLDQFDEDKNGLIFIPSWYNTGLKIIEKLEFKDRITPELIWLITDKTITVEELYNIFVKHDDKIAHYIDEAVALRELIDNRLKVLEKERLSLKETLMDLTEKRLIKDIDRRQFSEDVMGHRRKVNILDINIKKCKDLLERLEHTSFGMLSKTMTSIDENSKEMDQRQQIPLPSSESVFQDHNKNDLYIEKYLELKQRYEKLLETHNELKIAVEKLLIKNE